MHPGVPGTARVRFPAVRTSFWPIGALVCGAAAMLAVHFLLLHTYWDYSEGVYALTAHEMLHGGDLYGQIVGAQPPGVFLTGVVLLAIHSSVEWLRFGVGCLQLGAGLIAGRIVYRLTASRPAAVLTPAAVLLTPWAVHEHGALTPELVALPVMMGAALLSADRERGLWAGLLCGLLVLIKLPLAIPAVALVLVGADRRKAAVAGLATVVVGLGLTWLVAGSHFWRDVVVAQIHSGSESLGMLKGFWAQAGWNVLGLLFCAAVAVWLRRRARDRRMMVVTLALAAATILTFLSNFKQGTGLNVTVPVEASLVPLAVAGTVFAVRAAPRWLPAVCVAALAFTLAQSISLITAPHNPVPWLRAFSAPAWEIVLTGPQFEHTVAAARACPPGDPYGGPPLVALDADRSLPAGQPDEFLPSHSQTLADVNAQIAAARNVCPPLALSGQ